MDGILITSSALIIILLILRKVFRKHLSRRVQYALWVFVLIRLLIPFNFPAADFSLLNIIQPVEDTLKERFIEAKASNGIYVSNLPNLTITENDDVKQSDHEISLGHADWQTVQSPSQQPLPSVPENKLSDGQQSQRPQLNTGILEEPKEEGSDYSGNRGVIGFKNVLFLIWIAGMVFLGLFFIVSNLSLYLRLRKYRVKYEVECYFRPVYFVKSDILRSPCLFGLIRPAVYLTPAVFASDLSLKHVLAHEGTHFKHLDMVWTFLRCVCLTVYWFNPLVWIAAAVSKADCELACDESVLAKLGEDERISYGKTLLSLIPVKGGSGSLIIAATTMSADKKRLKERFMCIAKKPRQFVSVMLIVCILTSIAVACTFTGANEDKGDGMIDTEKLIFSGNVERINKNLLNPVQNDFGSSYNLPIAAGKDFVVAIDKEGKAVLSSRGGIMDDVAAEIEKWDNLVGIAAGKSFIIGIKKDGNVVSWGREIPKEKWHDIVSINVGASYIVGVKSDGTVVTDGELGYDRVYAKYYTENWTDIVQVVSGKGFLVGLKKDGTVIAAGNNDFGQCDVCEWQDVVMLAAGNNHVVGLRSDGTVLSAGADIFGQCDVSDWKDIVFIAAGNELTIGVNCNGMLAAVGGGVEKLLINGQEWSDVACISIGNNVVFGITKVGGNFVLGGYGEEYDFSNFKHIVLEDNTFDIDFSKQTDYLLPTDISSANASFISFDVKENVIFADKEYILPEEGEIKADSFSVRVPDELSDNICYISEGDSISVYLKDHVCYNFNKGINKVQYSLQFVGKIEKYQGIPICSGGALYLYNAELIRKSLLKAESVVFGPKGKDFIEYTYYMVMPPSEESQNAVADYGHIYEMAREWIKDSIKTIES